MNAFIWPTNHALTRSALAREKNEAAAEEDIGHDDSAYDAEVGAAVAELVAAHVAYEK